MNTGQIVKAKVEVDFSIVPNSISQNKFLTLEERGLLIYLLSLPLDWVIYKSNLHKLTGEREGTIDRVFRSLQEKGYILSVKKISNTGNFCGWDHVVYREPTLKDQPRIEPTSTNPDLGQNRSIQIDNSNKEQNNKKEKEDILSVSKEVIDHLNQKTNSSFRPETPSTKTKIASLIKQGFTTDDIKLVISHKTSQWLNNNDMSKYLRPETLFGGHFEAYLQEAKRTSTPTRPKLPEQQW